MHGCIRNDVPFQKRRDQCQVKNPATTNRQDSKQDTMRGLYFLGKKQASVPKRKSWPPLSTSNARPSVGFGFVRRRLCTIETLRQVLNKLINESANAATQKLDEI